jgi:radical SAM-linked protein
MAYSSGFNPHPRISWANPAPTGAESEAEYVDLGLATVMDLAAVGQALEAAFPLGLAVVGVASAEPGGLMSRLLASAWSIELRPASATSTAPPASDTAWRQQLAAAVAAFTAADTVIVERETKRGPRQFDARSAVTQIELEQTERSVVSVVIEHTSPLVRPDDVVRAFQQLDPELNFGAVLSRRLAQGSLRAGQVVDPVQPSLG